MKKFMRLILIAGSTGVLQWVCAAQVSDPPSDRGIAVSQSNGASFIQEESTPMNSQYGTAIRFLAPEGSNSSSGYSRESIRPEHVAFNVPDPVAAVKWYTGNLGMKVMRKGGPPTFTSFVADSGEHMMMELFHNADYPLLEPAKMSHMSIHLAFMVNDIEAIKTKLVAAGATLVEDITKTPSGDQVLMLRDPWGLPIQFAQRVKPMLKATGVRPEHLALNVSDSRTAARWFVAHMGMKVVREGGAPTYGMFVADSSEQMMLELYQNSSYPVVDFRKISHMSIHFASMVPDVGAAKERLLKEGATLAEDVTKTPAGDQVVMLRDPNGFPIQFVNRAAPMLK
ncbi:MAG: VOC family protein [Bacteroidota bacterium]|jgi:catechol 2,3-dioxygenase-like lactoylglutathione lyase family enzyme